MSKSIWRLMLAMRSDWHGSDARISAAMAAMPAWQRDSAFILALGMLYPRTILPDPAILASLRSLAARTTN